MLAYARRCITSRKALWAPVAACTFLTIPPASVVALALAAPLVALLLTGDMVLSFTLLPDPFRHATTAGAAAWSAVVAVVVAGLAIYTRVYAVAVWISDERKDPDLAFARRETAQTWRTVFALYLHAGLALAGVAGLLAGVALAAGSGATGFATVAVLAGVLVVISVRTVLRVLLTLAVRAAVLDWQRARSAWRLALDVARDRRRLVMVAWMVLVAAGVTVWVGGRLISPVLQDTAFDYPSDSSYALAREVVQVAIAVPLEALLMALALGVWTAVFLEVEIPNPSEESRREHRRDPWVLRGLAGLAAIALIANGVPTIIESAWVRHEETRREEIEAREIQPFEVLRSPGAPRETATPTTRYQVNATLDGERLEWETHISYLNNTDETLSDIGFHIFPAAYERDVVDIPLAAELLMSDLSGRFEANARPGSLDVVDVRVEGEAADHRLDGTGLSVDLADPVASGERVEVAIELAAELPHFPERFGVWEDTILLGNWIPVVAVRREGEWRLDEFVEIGDPFFAEVARYDVRIELDDGLSAVGTGTLRSVDQVSSDRRAWRFSADASRDAAFAIGRYMRGLEAEVAGVHVRSWYPADERVRGDANLRAAVSAVRHYVARWGGLPHDEVEIVETPGMLGGMEYPGVLFVSTGTDNLEGLPLVEDLITHVGFDDAQAKYVVGHEVAHQWWYATVGSDPIREPWLDEALAEVGTRLWLRADEGSDRTWRITNLLPSASPRDDVVDADVTDFSTNAGYTSAVYVAGAEVLMRLREVTGPELFDTVLRTWYREQALGIGTIDEFIATTERVAGADAADVIRRYR